MARSPESLTGIWHGLYTYASQPEPVYFVATLIQSGTLLMGTTHESEEGRSGAPLTLFASIDGRIDQDIVTFTKAYDGSHGWEHQVSYEGLLNGDRTEIEGNWRIEPSATQMGARGRFLMIRSSGASEAAVRKVFARA
ncbi:MAG: hypothetical protein J0L51_05145 [Rhizobiales bacterium]|nr:hypothetical protein [Hyphomicrobiales bacterium]